MAYPISDVPRRIVYSGSAGVGPYAFTFEVLANTDIAVYKNTTLLTLTTDYTVSINTGTGTGTVTLVVAATGSDQITIVGDRAIQRTSDFVTGGDLFANTLNDELDAQVIYTQQVDEKAERALKSRVTDPTTLDMTLPAQATRANKLLGFSASGEPVASLTTVAQMDAAVSSFVNATGNNAASILYTPESGPDTSVEAALDTALRAGMRNKIINGKMDIAQRGTSFAAASGYTLDRFTYYNNGPGVGVVTISQQADVPSSNEFQNSLRVTVTPTADTSIAAGDLYVIGQTVEGFNARDLMGHTFTLSFWARSSKTGVHCVSFKNSGQDRTYVAEYSISAANTWEFKTITISGGLITDGTWNWTTGTGLIVSWALACGSAFQTTANAWGSGNFAATSNQVNCLDTVGNIFAITGVQLEVGDIATPFEHRHYGAELALCQRYYYRLGPGLANNNIIAPGCVISSTLAYGVLYFPVEMRIRPLTFEHSGAADNYRIVSAVGGENCTAIPISTNTAVRGALLSFTASGLSTGQGCILTTGTSTGVNAYLAWSAEL